MRSPYTGDNARYVRLMPQPACVAIRTTVRRCKIIMFCAAMRDEKTWQKRVSLCAQAARIVAEKERSKDIADERMLWRYSYAQRNTRYARHAPLTRSAQCEGKMFIHL